MNNKTTIHTKNTHDFEVGNIIEITTLDHRWWRKLFCWLMKKPNPTIKSYSTITSKDQTTLTIVK